MCRFSHFSKRNREKTNKFLTLAYVISILIHGLAQIATSVWLLVSKYLACEFLQKYYAPVYLHVTSGFSAVLVAVSSIIGTNCCHFNCHVRYFVLGIGIVVSLEFSSILSAVVLDNMTKTHLPAALKTTLSSTMNFNNDSILPEHVTCWTRIQELHKCCGVIEYTDWCKRTKNTTKCEWQTDLFQGCECNSDKKQNKCVTFNNETIYKSSCMDSLSGKFAETFKMIIAMDASFSIMQCLSYIVLNCLLSRLNTKCVVDVYKISPPENEAKL